MGATEETIVQEIEMSYEKVRQHFNLMCLELNHNLKREEPILVINQAEVVSNNTTGVEKKELDSEIKVKIFDKTDNMEF